MKVLIACEESQEVCKAFRKLGHEAYSCDLLDCSGGHPEWHIQGDVLPLLEQPWDIIIAHPPCTYMSKAGARWMYHPAGILDEERLSKALDAKKFFMQFFNCDCERICIENPIPLQVVNLPPFTQKNTTVSLRRTLFKSNTFMAQRATKVKAYVYGRRIYPIPSK